MICIAIDNGSNNTVGGSYYPAHQAVSNFAEHHIDMVSCVHRKWQTRARLECQTRLEQLDFGVKWWEWELPNQLIANCILPPAFLRAVMTRN